jgi:hypothetical protein
MVTAQDYGVNAQLKWCPRHPPLPRSRPRGAAGQGDDDPDDPKAGDGKGVKFSERL